MGYMQDYEIDYQLFHEMVSAERERLGERLGRGFDYVADYREVNALAACNGLMDYLAGILAADPDRYPDDES